MQTLTRKALRSALKTFMACLVTFVVAAIAIGTDPLGRADFWIQHDLTASSIRAVIYACIFAAGMYGSTILEETKPKHMHDLPARYLRPRRRRAGYLQAFAILHLVVMLVVGFRAAFFFGIGDFNVILQWTSAIGLVGCTIDYLAERYGMQPRQATEY